MLFPDLISTKFRTVNRHNEKQSVSNPTTAPKHFCFLDRVPTYFPFQISILISKPRPYLTLMVHTALFVIVQSSVNILISFKVITCLI